MSEYKFNKDSIERKAFNDLWQLYQEVWIPEDKDEYWEQLVHATDDMSRKYKGTEVSLFVNMSISNLLAYLETKLRESKEENDEN